MWFIFIFIPICSIENQIVINQVKNPIFIGMLQQKKQTGIWGEVLDWEVDFIDHDNILAAYFFTQIFWHGDFIKDILLTHWVNW